MPPDDDYPQRERHPIHSVREDFVKQPSAKRRRAGSDDYPPEFWDALSKVTLTRRALIEFDRRTAVEKSAPEAVAGKRSTRLLRSDTRKLLHFTRSGGPNLTHLRGYSAYLQPVANMSKSSSRKGKRTRDFGLPSSEATKTSSTRASGTTGPYNSQFQQLLTDRGVFPDGYRGIDGSRPPKPTNLNELRQMLLRTRPSLSPSAFSEGTFEEFQEMNRRANSEAKAMSSVVPIITGAKDNRLETEENILFNNLEKFAPGLKVAQPDKYYGARPEQVDERIRRDLGQYIVPSTSTSLPVAPNFFFEGKSARGRADVAQRQVTQDNAYGARAMFQIQNYGIETPAYDGNAYAIGTSYSDGQLKLYSTHPRRSPNGGIEYHITQLDTYGMTGNIETFRRGAAAYRNARDFAQEQRDRLIAQANVVAGSAGNEVLSSRTGVSFAVANNSFGSDTSADELALHHGVSSDESDRKAYPWKRVAPTASKRPRPRSSACVRRSSHQVSNATSSKNTETSSATRNRKQQQQQ